MSLSTKNSVKINGHIHVSRSGSQWGSSKWRIESGGCGIVVGGFGSDGGGREKLEVGEKAVGPFAGGSREVAWDTAAAATSAAADSVEFSELSGGQ